MTKNDIGYKGIGGLFRAIDLSKLLQLSEKSAAGGKLIPHEKVKERIEETLRRIKK